MSEVSVEQRVDVDAISEPLDEAWQSRSTIEPLSETQGLVSAELAYRIQTRWTALRVERHGDQVIGHKIGLTSRAMQEQMGVDEPDYGSLWRSRFYPATAGRATIPANVLIQPRAEGELAFLIGRPLRGASVTVQDVLVATDAIAASIEIIDSRITDFRIKLADTVADNASYGALTLGPWNASLRSADLRTIGMVIHHNASPVIHGAGAAALGHPARSVAWLASKLGQLGAGLEPGDIVLSGSLGPSLPVAVGDVFTVETYGLPPLSVLFG